MTFLAPQRHTVDATASSNPGVAIAAAWRALGLTGRRTVVAIAGAMFALGGGAAVAGVLRLPADTHKSPASADEVIVQTESPAETAARTYALENPPVYPAAFKTAADDIAPAVDPTPNVSLTDDDSSDAEPAIHSSADAVTATPVDPASVNQASKNSTPPVSPTDPAAG